MKLFNHALSASILLAMTSLQAMEDLAQVAEKSHFPFQDLPGELKLSIFEYLPYTEFLSARLVCSNWDSLIMEKPIYPKLYQVKRIPKKSFTSEATLPIPSVASPIFNELSIYTQNILNEIIPGTNPPKTVYEDLLGVLKLNGATSTDLTFLETISTPDSQKAHQNLTSWVEQAARKDLSQLPLNDEKELTTPLVTPSNFAALLSQSYIRKLLNKAKSCLSFSRSQNKELKVINPPSFYNVHYLPLGMINFIFPHADTLTIKDSELPLIDLSQLAQFTNLKHLTLNGLKLNYLPSQINTLKNLEVLDISNNLFSRFPSELKELPRLKEVLIYNNMYDLDKPIWAEFDIVLDNPKALTSSAS